MSRQNRPRVVRLGAVVLALILAGVGCTSDAVTSTSQSIVPDTPLTTHPSTTTSAPLPTTTTTQPETTTTTTPPPLEPAFYLAEVLELNAAALFETMGSPPDKLATVYQQLIDGYDALIPPAEYEDHHRRIIVVLGEFRDANLRFADGADGDEAEVEQYLERSFELVAELAALEETEAAWIRDILSRREAVPEAAYLVESTGVRLALEFELERLFSAMARVLTDPDMVLQAILDLRPQFTSMRDDWSGLEPPPSLAHLHEGQIELFDEYLGFLEDLETALNADVDSVIALSLRSESLSFQAMAQNAGWAYATAAVLRGETPESTLVIETDTTLTADHSGDVFIAADNIVLDCANFAIDGSSRVGVGIFERSGVIIRNCAIAGFDIGVVLVGSTGVVLEANTLVGDRTAETVTQAILLDTSPNNTITGHSITHYAIGINLTNSSDNVIESNTINGTGSKWGIGMLDDSTGNRIAGNDTSRTEAGILLARGASQNEITENNSSHNSKGFEATNSFDNAFTANLATDNDFAGFWLAGSDGNTVATNDIRRGGFGIVVQDCHNNLFESNKIDGTRDWFAFGISEASQGNIVSSNEVIGGGVAFAVYIGATGNTFSNNTVLNSSKGFHITDASSIGNLITANEITGATEIALHDQTSGSGDSGTGNTFADNTCKWNATDSVPGDLCGG